MIHETDQQAADVLMENVSRKRVETFNRTFEMEFGIPKKEILHPAERV